VNGFEQEWKQKFACSSQGDLEVYYHILDPESFKFFCKLLLFQQKLCLWLQMRLHFLSSNRFSTEWASPLKSESDVLKEVTRSTV
jgi:hypothetical protein